MSFSAHRFLK
jgi:zinc transporter ZupT